MKHMKLISKVGDDLHFEDVNKFGIIRAIDVCKKSNGKIALHCYNKQMNSDGEFNSIPIYLDEIKEIMELLELEHEE